VPPQQIRRLLEALRENTSVNVLCICELQYHEGAFWIADMLRRKTKFVTIHLYKTRFALTHILPFLLSKGQPHHLKALGLCDCRIKNNGLLQFEDPESTQLFVDNVLMSPSTAITSLYLFSRGLSL
jgi:hypothetical protein